ATFALKTYPVRIERVGEGTGTVSDPLVGIDCGEICEVEVTHGTMLMPEATPSATSVFSGWEGCATTDPTCGVLVTEPTTIQARFDLAPRGLLVRKDGTGSGTVVSDPAGVDCGSDCEEIYLDGERVTLTATPDEASSTFTEWSGACSGRDPVCTVSMTEARSTTATFTLIDRRLSVRTQGGGSGTVTSDPAGIDCGADCAEEIPHGTSVTLTATPDAGSSSFEGWGGACSGSGPTCTVAMDRARDVVARFALLPRSLRVTTDGTGAGAVSSAPAGIDCGSDCDQDFDHGTSVTLTAAPNTGTSRFAGWGGACSGSGATCTVEMTRARAVTATFELLDRRLTVRVRGSGAGTVTSSPAGIGTCDSGDCTADYPHGTRVTLTAAPNTGTSRFAGWSGACGGGGTTCSVTMDRARTVTARFELLDRRLTVQVRGNGAGTVTSSPTGISCTRGDCRRDFPHGTRVTLTAAPNTASSRFTGWGGACRGGGTTCTVDMTAARTATATFELLDRRLDVTTTGPGSVTSSPSGIDCDEDAADCAETYSHGTTVTLTATPGSTGTFVGWSGACSGSSPTCTVPMTAARSVTATFRLVFNALTVRRSEVTFGTGRVTGTGIDCGADCSQSFVKGTTVTLTATPDRNSRFMGWSGACSHSARTCTVVMSEAREVTARFLPVLRTLDVDLTGSDTDTTVRLIGGGGVRTCDRSDACRFSYSHGDEVTLEVVLDREAGAFISRWGGACSGTAGTDRRCGVSMTADRDVTILISIFG
ncbi:MAG TPA: hypothetical protein RMF84_16215, partial [Polyangiaceae bacterium LLY-WYZ-14_1]|nr:hypothetical protein [Polyangiaceae bacterium LLY-WYZ-14_1]